MPNVKKFLVVDLNPDSRMLLTRTLKRVFPQCALEEVEDFEAALSSVREQPYDAIICHRAIGADAVTLVRSIRAVTADTPILAVSGIDRSTEVLAAGANRFLNYEEWLRVGTILLEIVAKSAGAGAPPKAPASSESASVKSPS
jgi:CheY-like chemotaxis protein